MSLTKLDSLNAFASNLPPPSLSPRHVVIGEAFGFEVTHQLNNILYLYFGGELAVLVWKCS